MHYRTPAGLRVKKDSIPIINIQVMQEHFSPDTLTEKGNHREKNVKSSN